MCQNDNNKNDNNKKLLYIIGNGFDLSLGMKTLYKDFLKYYKRKGKYCKKKQLDDLIKEYELWADAEIAFGNFSAKFKDKDQYIDYHKDIKEKLIEYLKSQQENLEIRINNETALDTIVRRLKTPEVFLTDQYGDNLNFNCGNVSAISFNYTTMFDRMLKLVDESVSDAMRLNVEPLHIHGSLDNKEYVVFGVDNEEQISNEDFRTNEMTVEMVKPVFNDGCNPNFNTRYENAIREADVYCLYGVSMGDSDLKWWKLIGDQMSGSNNQKKVCYFKKCDDVSQHPNHWSMRRDEIRDMMMEKMGLEQTNHSAKERLFIEFNKNPFEFLQVK